jgi:acylglycerol kinase
MKLLTTLRNNWKKSTFAGCLFVYGTYYLVERKYTANLLQEYCFEALKYGTETVKAEQVARRCTVFLNASANNERGRFSYEKNVAPLLHLAGVDVKMIRLESPSKLGTIKDFTDSLDLSETDCIVIAGGNATLNEVISAILSRPDGQEV